MRVDPGLITTFQKLRFRYGGTDPDAPQAAPEGPAAEGEKKDPKEVLGRLETSGKVFAVFKTKPARDKALELAKAGAGAGTLQYTAKDGQKYA